MLTPRQLFDKEAQRIWAKFEEYAAADQLHAAVRDDGWTPWQIMVHILTATTGMIKLGQAQLRAGEPQSEASRASFDLHRWNEEQVAGWNGRSVDELQTAWQQAGPLFDQFVEQCASAPADLKLYHPVGQLFAPADYIGVITIHMRMHRQELETGQVQEH